MKTNGKFEIFANSFPEKKPDKIHTWFQYLLANWITFNSNWGGMKKSLPKQYLEFYLKYVENI